MIPVSRPSASPARAPRRAAVVAALLLLAPAALAQGAGADLVTGYRAVSGALDSARVRLTGDPQGARARVEAARNSLRALAPAIRSERLNDGARAALDAAVTAVQRGSAADLAAQSTQVRSVLQRALYDALFVEIGAGRVDGAQRHALALAYALSMPEASRRNLLNASGNLNAARTRGEVETHLTSAMRNALSRARAEVADRPTAFQSAVRAAGAFLVVQDSPRAGDLNVSEFSSALALLADGDAAGFRASVDNLLAANERFAAAARATLASPAAPAASEPTPQAPAVSEPTTPAPAASAPVTSQPAPSLPAAPAPAPAAEELSAALVRAGVPARGAPGLAADLSAAGLSSLPAVLDGIRAPLGEALALAQDARIPAATERLEAARAAFRATLHPILETVDPALASRSSRAFDATGSGLASLRPVDLGVLLGEVQAAADRLGLGAPGASAMQAAAAAVHPAWAGLLRGPVFLILALLFAYPIYLLNLAFGGRNPYWRYIGIAMVLLFLPALLEGLVWLGSVLAQATGAAWLHGLANLSVLSSPVAQLAWALVLALTLGFATAGFRGIAMQFGLIRSRNQPAGATVLESGRAGAATGEKPAETIVEWDEEF